MPQRIAIIGGGVTGLAAAHRLLELSRERGLEVHVRLLEAGTHLGGLISTARRDGFVLEHGPDSMITDKPWGIALARRLGLEDQLIGTQEAHRRSFVVRKGRLEPVPEGFQLLAPSRFGPLLTTSIFSPWGKLRMGMDLFIPRRATEDDESLGSFVTRRLGREALERIAQPMIAGIYGADPMKLSLRATLPRFLDMEREHGSVIRAMWARKGGRTASGGANGSGAKPGGPSGVSGARYGLFVSFRDGMQTLTDALAARIPPESVRLGTRVTALERGPDGWLLQPERGEAEVADGVILALPAYRSAALVRDLDPTLSELLEGIHYASAATMTLCYRREDVPHPLDGFGFVVPEKENLHLLGCTFTHVKYAHRAPAGFVLLRAFLGDRALNGRDEAELQKLVREDLRKLVGVSTVPLFIETWRGSRCMPHYYVGHLDRVAEIERRATAIPGLALAGNAYHGVGIPDSIHSGEQAAEAMLASVFGR
jgi:oxygen-dependent protoporphyrinogen oxidase